MNEQIRLLMDAVKKGSIAAAYSLAESFKWGYYGEPDPRRAARLYRICCRSKDAKMASVGYYNLGVLYYYGFLNEECFGESEPSRAFSCFMKSAVILPNADALSRLADMYRYGQYVEKNERVALSLYLKATATA